MKIPGYTIRRRIGAGGQALVYLAIQESLGREVALKVLHPVHSGSPEFSTRFLNEARILANLGHSNVITIHDAGVEGEFHYLSMEVVEGGDLKQRIADGLDVDTTLGYLITIADCLANAHHKKIVHRDIKPGNVLFRRDGTLLLTDFGIAKQLDRDGELTVSGATIGSPNYLSPEQAQGRPLDGRADIYSLGAMAFEMLTGRKPYGGSSEIDTIFKHINAPVPRLPDGLQALQPLIERSMAKSPEDRFGSAVALRDYLRALGSSLHTGEAMPDVNAAVTPAPGVQDREHTTELWLDLPATRSSTSSISRHSIALFTLAALLLVGAWLSFTSEDPESVHDAADGADAKAKHSEAAPPAGSAVVTSPSPQIPSATSPQETGVPTPRVETTPAPQLADTPAPQLAGTPAPQLAGTLAPQLAGTPAPRLAAGAATPGGGASAAPAAASETPAPQATTSIPQVDGLLQRAELAMEELRLTRPEDDSAFLYYQQVLEQDPGNVAARKGLAEIARRYAGMAKTALGRNSISEAGSYIRRGLAVDASNPQLLALETRLARGDDPPRENQPARPGAATTGEIQGETPGAATTDEIQGETPGAATTDEIQGERPGAATTDEIQGETPAQLLNRIKGWFKK